MQRQSLIPTLGAFAFTFPSALAQETPLSGPALHSHCKAYQDEPYSPSGLVCSSYVRGFLDGAASIDARVIEPYGKQVESWTERAERTRLGSRLIGDPRYCVDSTAPITQIIREILLHAQDNPPNHDSTAHDLVRFALQRFHGC